MIRDLLGETDPYCDEIINTIYSKLVTRDTISFNLDLDWAGNKPSLFTLMETLRESNKTVVCFIKDKTVMSKDEVIDYFQGDMEVAFERGILNFAGKYTDFNNSDWYVMTKHEQVYELTLESYDGNLLKIANLGYPELFK